MENPRTYEEFLIKINRNKNPIIEELVEKLEAGPGETILDFGCGTGRITKHFFAEIADRNESLVYGLDISESMIEFARENHSHPRIVYLVGDLLRGDNAGEMLGIKDGTVGHIFSFLVLHWIPKYSELVRKLFKLLAPGGKFAFAIPTKDVSFNVTEFLRQITKWEELLKGSEVYVPDWHHAGDVDGKLLREALESAGFLIKEYKTLHYESQEKSIDEVSDLCYTVHPSTSSMPAALLPEFKKDIADYLTGLLNDKSTSSLVFESDYVIGIAVKPLE